mgnify:CR=1 FL=1
MKFKRAELKEMFQGWIDDINGGAINELLEGTEPDDRKSYDKEPKVYESGYVQGYREALENVIKNL